MIVIMNIMKMTLGSANNDNREADGNNAIMKQESPRVPEGDEAVVGHVPISTERTER